MQDEPLIETCRKRSTSKTKDVCTETERVIQVDQCQQVVAEMNDQLTQTTSPKTIDAIAQTTPGEITAIDMNIHGTDAAIQTDGFQMSVTEAHMQDICCIHAVEKLLSDAKCIPDLHETICAPDVGKGELSDAKYMTEAGSTHFFDAIHASNVWKHQLSDSNVIPNAETQHLPQRVELLRHSRCSTPVTDNNPPCKEGNKESETKENAGSKPSESEYKEHGSFESEGENTACEETEETEVSWFKIMKGLVCMLLCFYLFLCIVVDTAESACSLLTSSQYSAVFHECQHFEHPY